MSRLFSNRTQMTSKCGKNKKVAHEPLSDCVNDVFTATWNPFVKYVYLFVKYVYLYTDISGF